MKKIFRKNQIIVASLALMIAVAGYLNFAYDNDEMDLAAMAEGKESEADEKSDVTASLTEDEILTDTEAQNEEDKGDETAGETVLTESTNVQVSKAASLKMDREQTRAAGKASLMEVVNNSGLSETEKQAAVEELAQITDAEQKEAACEMMLSSKGFAEAVVSISGENADVILNMEELTDVQRAQVEDVVNRKAGISPDHIVISVMN